MAVYGFYRFNSEKEKKEKQMLLDFCDGIQKVYAGRGDNLFWEFIATIVSEGDTVFVTSYYDIDTDFELVTEKLNFLNLVRKINVIILSDVLLLQ